MLDGKGERGKKRITERKSSLEVKNSKIISYRLDSITSSKRQRIEQ